MLRPCLAFLLCATAGCAPSPSPQPGPPTLGIDAQAIFAHHRAARLDQFKMRHQVETSFGPRSEVVEGFLIVDRPDRFWVRAMSPFGATLFDVKDLGGGDMQVDIRLDEVKDQRAPQFLARDIRRIYLSTCNADAAVKAVGDAAVARCALAGTEPAIETDAGPDRPDDALALHIDAAGLLRKKIFSRAGADTARIELRDYRQHGARWFAHRIELDHAQVSYGLTIELLDVDPAFDAAALFARQPAGAPAP